MISTVFLQEMAGVSEGNWWWLSDLARYSNDAAAAAAADDDDDGECDRVSVIPASPFVRSWPSFDRVTQ